MNKAKTPWVAQWIKPIFVNRAHFYIMKHEYPRSICGLTGLRINRKGRIDEECEIAVEENFCHYCSKKLSRHLDKLRDMV